MNNGHNYTGYRSFWQEMEGRKRRYQVLEQNDFNANVDYPQLLSTANDHYKARKGDFEQENL